MNKLWTLRRFVKNIGPVWRYYSNFSPTVRYHSGARDRLTKEETNLLAKLNMEGVATTSIEDLLGVSSDFQEVQKATAELLEIKRDEVEKLKSTAGASTAIGKKTFNLECLGSEIVFDAGTVFARFALNAALLRIANAYFRMQAKLRYYNVWYTAASGSTPRESQLWHFDREDNYILKVFLYLDDVDEGAGPFTYAPGTHRKGKYRKIKPESFLEGDVRRTTDDQMKAVYPEKNWVRAVGKKGTIIFADTRGFHKGGEARTKDRLMFTCMFTSPASESKRLIVFPDNVDVSPLTSKQRQALQYQ